MSETTHRTGTREEWNQARRELLAQEKKLTHLRDELSEKRRALPWVRVDQPYTFQTIEGTRSLSDLFGDKSQLLVYHFMFAPEWEAGCKSCSFWAEGFSSSLVHLAHRDVQFTAISRAPLAKLVAYQKRMGWSFPWASSEGSTFNYDYAVSFTEAQQRSGERNYNFGTIAIKSSDMPGFSAFAKDEHGTVFHTYSCYTRGIELTNATYGYLDLMAKGRDEGGQGMAWLRRRDEYEG